MLQAALAGYAGLLVSYYASVPSGPVIIVCAGALYVLSLLFAPRGWLPRLLRRPHLQA
jgi:zinc/manganese transport system permease protein